MAEDSGAFKTNPRNSARIGHFVITAIAAAKMPHGSKNAVHRPNAAIASEFCNEQVRGVEIFSNRPDSRCESGSVPVVTAFPSASTALQPLEATAELASMLPGFRFLFAAIILSMSVLVFGLGAAALLRAAHEQFASIPSRRALPEPVFAQHNEPPMPTLALLRFEPPVADKAPDNVPENAVAVAPAETGTPAAPVFEATPAETEQLAALKPEETTPAEPVKPEIPAAEPAPVTQATPAETPAANDEVKLAAIEEPPPPATMAASTAPEAVAEAPSPEGNIAATKIATLGGPAATIGQPESAKTKSAKPDRSAIRKRAKERRRIAARRAAALQTPQAAAQQQPDPFTQPAAARAKR